MLWNAVALRFSHRDFKGYTIDGAEPTGPSTTPTWPPTTTASNAKSASAETATASKTFPTASTTTRRPSNWRPPSPARSQRARHPHHPNPQSHAHPRNTNPPRLPLLRKLHGRLRRSRQVRLRRRPPEPGHENRQAHQSSPTPWSAKSSSPKKTAPLACTISIASPASRAKCTPAASPSPAPAAKA